MKVKYEIAALVEGDLNEVTGANIIVPATLAEVLATLGNLAFAVETVAHLQGREGLLPTADKARELIAKLGG